MVVLLSLAGRNGWHEKLETSQGRVVGIGTSRT
jgi:hypothetical protein